MQQSPESQINEITLEQKIALLNFPCFKQFTNQQIQELAKHFFTIDFNPGEVIVTENEIIDSVYIIYSGNAEVTKHVKKNRKFSNIPIAELHANESIGLNESGFYSATGKRTAAVTAINSVRAIKINLEQLHAFLKNNNLESMMYQAAEEMLRMQLIKQSLPFSKLSAERLQWLAKKVEERFLAADDLLFQEGDDGHECFLICEGEIEILQRHTKQLAILKKPMLFGEATLIMHAPRNAAARALTPVKLLVLDQRYLSELMENEETVSDVFMSLMIDRSRPLQNNLIDKHIRHTVDGQEIIILKNPQNNRYLKLSNEADYIWSLLDGENTLKDITLNFCEKFEIFAPEMVTALIAKLSKAGFIENLDIRSEPAKSKSRWKRFARKTRSLLEYRKTFGDADPFISRIYQRSLYLLFTKPAMILISLFIACGTSLFFLQTNDIIHLFQSKQASPWISFLLIPLSLVNAALHELGHAIAVKHYRREVHHIGIGWNWLGPMAFTDTSDMWLAPRSSRIVVNMAGIVSDLFMASLASCLAYSLVTPNLNTLLWLFSLFTYINAFRNLSPLQDMDGYYMLMDWLDKPRLRQSAIIWLINCFKRNKSFALMHHKAEICYWAACLLFLASITLLIFYVQTFILKSIGLQQINPYLILALPFLITFLSSLIIINEIRTKS